MNKKRTSMTAQELMEKLQADPEYVEATRQQDIEFSKKLKKLIEEQEPIKLDLKEVGCKVESVWDLVNTSNSYPKAIPVLLKHLAGEYSDRTLEGIARALAVPEPEVKKAWPLLVNAYCNAPMGKGVKFPRDDRHFNLGFKDGLACALSASVTDETMEEYINLIKDQRHGSYRMLLIPALRKSKNPLAKKALEDLKDDPDLKREIAQGIRKRK